MGLLIFSSPFDVKRAKSNTVRAKEGLFGVCGRAAELGSFAFDNVSEMLLASELFVLKYLKIVIELSKQPVAKKSSSSYCIWKSLTQKLQTLH